MYEYKKRTQHKTNIEHSGVPSYPVKCLLNHSKFKILVKWEMEHSEV